MKPFLSSTYNNVNQDSLTRSMSPSYLKRVIQLQVTSLVIILELQKLHVKYDKGSAFNQIQVHHCFISSRDDDAQ